MMKVWSKIYEQNILEPTVENDWFYERKLIHEAWTAQNDLSDIRRNGFDSEAKIRFISTFIFYKRKDFLDFSSHL